MQKGKGANYSHGLEFCLQHRPLSQFQTCSCELTFTIFRATHLRTGQTGHGKAETNTHTNLALAAYTWQQQAGSGSPTLLLAFSLWLLCLIISRTTHKSKLTATFLPEQAVSRPLSNPWSPSLTPDLETCSVKPFALFYTHCPSFRSMVLNLPNVAAL